MIIANAKLPTSSTVYDWLNQMYAMTAVMAVRRQADKDDNSLSLLNLLKEIKADHQEISRGWFVAQYPLDMERTANYVFDTFGPRGAMCVSAVTVEEDISLLTDITEGVRKFVNKRVAHISKTTNPGATWGQLDAAIDIVGELVKKYRLLLTQQSLMTLEPVIQENWRSLFSISWYPADQSIDQT